MNLTEEQKQIITSKGNIKINAVAGSGKTTTLIEFARNQPPRTRILYLAFNRSVKMEARDKFNAKGIKNTVIHTPHSLAYKNIVPLFNYSVNNGYRPHEILSILDVRHSGTAGLMLASHINAFTSLFCSYTTESVSELNYEDTVKNEAAKQFFRKFKKEIVLGTRRFLSKMNCGEIPVTHAFYLKKYQLSRPVLSFDLMLFDEGQDASPVMLDIFLHQKARKVIVGDIHQQIYGWRHAVNALQNVDFREFTLSTSFRFDKSIASIAAKTLDWKIHLNANPGIKIKGAGKRNKKPGTQAFIARTNLTLFVNAIRMIFDTKEISSLYFEGNINSYTYASEGTSLFDALNLFSNKRSFIRDPLVKNMKDFSELCLYAESQEDHDLLMIIELVKKYGSDIPKYIRKLREIHVDDDQKNKADMIFSTVHRCKGMEYDSVILGDDFITEERVKREADKINKNAKTEMTLSRINEEINLLYVAVTRCGSWLKAPERILPEAPAGFRFRNHSELYTKTSKAGTFFKSGKTKGNRPKRSHKNWTSEEDITLEKMLHKEIFVNEIAKEFARSRYAIKCRIRKLGLDNIFFNIE